MHARPVQARAIAGADIQNKHLACLLLSSFLFFEAYVALFDERAARFRGILFAVGLQGEALFPAVLVFRSEEDTSELQSLMRISYAVFCLKKKTKINYISSYYNSSCKQQQNITNNTQRI